MCHLHILIKRNIQIMLQSLMCRFHFLVCSEDYPTPVASYYHKNYLFEGLSSWVEAITKTYPSHSTYDPKATALSILFFKFLLPTLPVFTPTYYELRDRPPPWKTWASPAPAATPARWPGAPLLSGPAAPTALLGQ